MSMAFLKKEDHLYKLRRFGSFAKVKKHKGTNNSVVQVIIHFNIQLIICNL